MYLKSSYNTQLMQIYISYSIMHCELDILHYSYNNIAKVHIPSSRGEWVYAQSPCMFIY